MNYLEIKNLVKFYAHRDDLDDILSSFFELAREKISKDCRLLVMEFSDLPIIVDGVAPLPIDFIEARLVVLNGRELDYKTPSQMVSTKMPNVYTIQGTNLVFKNAINGAALVLDYYAKPDNLVDDTDTNLILSNYPTLYLHSVLETLHNSIQDTENEVIAKQNYSSAFTSANKMDAKARFSGSTLIIQGR